MSGKRIFEEVKNQVKCYGIDQFVFHDSLINGDMKVLNDFCNLMIKNKLDLILLKNRKTRSKSKLGGILWGGQAVVRPEMTFEMLKKMKTAGCYRLSYGIESGSQSVLEKMNKKIDLDEARAVLKNTHDAGIIVQMNLLVGFPSETSKDFKNTLNFFKRVRPYLNNISPALTCEIVKGTMLEKDRGKFGVAVNNDPVYWSSDKGRNNYAERFNRYEKLCKLAIDSGIPQDVGLFHKRPHKWLLLNRYYACKNDHLKAAQCLKKYSRTKEGKIFKKELGFRTFANINDSSR